MDGTGASRRVPVVGEDAILDQNGFVRGDADVTGTENSYVRAVMHGATVHLKSPVRHRDRRARRPPAVRELAVDEDGRPVRGDATSIAFTAVHISEDAVSERR